MPDIPLRFTRRNKTRAEYAPLADSGSPSPTTDSVEMHGIRPTVTVVASSSVAARRNAFTGKGKGKHKDKYTDDPEEEAGLLKNDVYDGDGDGDYEDAEGQLPGSGSTPSVCLTSL